MSNEEQQLTRSGYSKVITETIEGSEKSVEDYSAPVEQPQLTEQEYIAKYTEFKESEENKKNAMFLAKNIIEIVGNNWFTLRRFCKKAGLTEQESKEKLSLVNIFGYLLNKNEKIKQDGAWELVSMYKICIDNESKIKELKEAVAYYEGQLLALKVQIEELENGKEAEK